MLIDDQPLVTVYIPTFNRLELLQRAVESVRNQTYQNLEIIIVDDCSTDGTQDYLVQLSKEDSRIRYFFKEKNSGACVSRNIAIENANGEFITGLDDDDYYEKNRILRFIEHWNDENIFLYTSYCIKRKNKTYKQGTFFVKKNINLRDLLTHNYVGNQIFCKTSTLIEVNGFDQNLRMWQDYDCWFRILKQTKKTAKMIPFYNYVIDMNHEYNRISDAKINKIRDTYIYFINKHQLNIKEITFLSRNMIYYDEDSYFLESLYKFCLVKNFMALKSIFVSLKRFFNV